MSTTMNWSEFYQQLLSQVKIPATAQSNLSQATPFEAIVVRDLVVSLSDIYDQLRDRNAGSRSVMVYADVLRITKSLTLNNSGLLITARRVEVDPDVAIGLDYRNTQNTKLVLFAHEIAGALPAKIITNTNGIQVQVVDLAQSQTVGTMISFQDTLPATRFLERFDDTGLAPGTPMSKLLTTTFQIASTIAPSHPDIARSMLEWIAAATLGSKTGQSLYLQSSAFLMQINALIGSTHFVPYLDKGVYRAIADSFTTAAMAYETQYQRFSDLNRGEQERIESATLMLQHYQDTTQLNAQLLEQAQTNYDQAQRALTQSENALLLQQVNVEQAVINFKFESQIWVREQILNAVMSMCIALGEFATSIALASVGAQAGMLGVNKALKESNKAIGSVILTDKKEEMAVQIAKLNQTMNNLRAITDSALKSVKGINVILDTAKTIGKKSPFKTLELPSLDNGQAAWDLFKIQSEAMLKPAVDKGVFGAAQYLFELNKLVVYGKAYFVNQLTLIQAAQELVQLTMQKQVSENQETRLKTYLKAHAQQAIQDQELMQIFFERGLNVKNWLVLALENYSKAYKYWSFNDSRVRGSILKSVLELQEDLGTIDQEYASALESFTPPPQSFQGITITIPETDDGVYKGVIANLKSQSLTQFTIQLDQPEFRGMDRVRLTQVRVWLDGVTASKSNPVFLHITNSGVYEDRRLGQAFTFSSASLERGFKYQGNVGDGNAIAIDGKVSDETTYRFFQPTPFTQWKVEIPKNLNPNIDLSTLRSITIEFAGSVIPTMKGAKNTIPA